MPRKLRQVLRHKTSYKNLVLIFFLLYPSFTLSLNVILFPVFLVRVSVWVNIERKDDFTDFFVEFGEKPTDGTSGHIDMLENFMLQLSGMTHDTLGAARLDIF